MINGGNGLTFYLFNKRKDRGGRFPFFQIYFFTKLKIPTNH